MISWSMVPQGHEHAQPLVLVLGVEGGERTGADRRLRGEAREGRRDIALGRRARPIQLRGESPDRAPAPRWTSARDMEVRRPRGGGTDGPSPCPGGRRSMDQRVLSDDHQHPGATAPSSERGST
jgi:hypothetical protein